MLLPDVASQVSLIEVVRITGRAPVYASERSEAVVGEDLAIWGAEQVRQVLNLVTDLPAGEQYRCFTPGYGIRAHSSAELLFEIAFCFRCHGALLAGPGVPSGLRGIQSFDPDSPAGRELLDRLRACEEG